MSDGSLEVPRVPRIQLPSFPEQIEMATRALKTGQLVFGPHLDELETWLCETYGKRHAVLTANGFSALFIALKSAVQDSRDIVTASVGTCFAIVNAIRAAGHRPLFADVEASTASIDQAFDRPNGDVAIVPDHFGLIASACKQPSGAGQLLIEDAAMAAISRSAVPTPADIVVLSFYAAKQLNGIDGGAVLTDDPEVAARARKLQYYEDQRAPESAIRYNVKLNNVNAAYLLGTIVHFDEMARRLKEVYEAFADALRRQGMPFMELRPGEAATRLMVVARDAAEKRRWFESLDTRGIGVANELNMLCPEQERANFPVAQRLMDTAFSIPFHPALTEAHVERILGALASV